jgi:hypothetical protein
MRYKPGMAIRDSKHWRRAAPLASALALWCGLSLGQTTPVGAERRALLEAIRPLAAQRAGQPVKFLVQHLNVDGDWALLTGGLVTTAGGPLDWRQAPECHIELDKLLWVLLSRQAGQWQVERLEICATEPPHWWLEQFGGYVWPCGVYAGLVGPTGADLQAACRSQPARQGSAPAPRPPDTGASR